MVGTAIAVVLIGPAVGYLIKTIVDYNRDKEVRYETVEREMRERRERERERERRQMHNHDPSWGTKFGTANGVHLEDAKYENAAYRKGPSYYNEWKKNMIGIVKQEEEYSIW